MAKLSKLEIRALAQQIRQDLYDEKKESVKEHNENVLNEFYSTSQGQYIKALLDDENTNAVINKHTVNRLAGVINNSFLSSEKIERKLIIQQIECDNIEELIKKVKESFNN